jgi:DNA-binding transcriptional ArsR family regulator
LRAAIGYIKNVDRNNRISIEDRSMSTTARNGAANGSEDWAGRADYFKAIADPARLAIVESLDGGAMTLDQVDHLARGGTRDPKRTATTIKSLEKSGIVETKGEGETRSYSLSRIGRALARASKTFLAAMRLGRAAQAEERAMKASKGGGGGGAKPKSKRAARKPAGKSRPRKAAARSA